MGRVELCWLHSGSSWRGTAFWLAPARSHQVSSLFSGSCFRKSTPDPTIVHLLSITEQLPFCVGLYFCSSKKRGRLRSSSTPSLPLQSEGGHTLLWSQGGGRLCDWQDCLNLSSKLLLSFPEKRRIPKATSHHTRPLTGRTQANSPISHLSLHVQRPQEHARLRPGLPHQAPDTNTMYYTAMAAADLLKDRRG